MWKQFLLIALKLLVALRLITHKGAMNNNEPSGLDERSEQQASTRNEKDQQPPSGQSKQSGQSKLPGLDERIEQQASGYPITESSSQHSELTALPTHEAST